MAKNGKNLMAAVEYDSSRDSPPHLIVNDDEFHEQPKSRSRKCLRMFFKFLLSHVGLTVLVLAYTVGGALVFISIEENKWLQAQNAKVDVNIPEEPEPLYPEQMAFNAKFWKANWMDDKVLRFWNHTHQINDRYPEDWQPGNYENIKLIEIQLQEHILREIVAIAKRYYVNQTMRMMRLESNKVNAPKWDFPNAFLFALSIITTIGYGHVYPFTWEGKLATILYAIIGIPIMLAFLANIGSLMAKGLRLIFDHLILMKCCRSLYKRRQARLQSMQAGGGKGKENTSGPPSVAGGSSPAPIRVQKQSLIVDDGTSVGVRSLKAYGYQPEELLVIREEKKQDKSVPVLMCVAVMAAYLFGGAVLFWLWEKDWTLWDSLYFCFITLSTIGLGDFVPGEALSKAKGGIHFQPVICCFYILLGLALLASCFNLLHDSARKGFRVVGKKMGLVKKKPRSRRTSNAAVV